MMWFGSFDPRAVLFTAPADIFGNDALEFGDRTEGPYFRIFVKHVRLAVVGYQLQQLAKLVLCLLDTWILVKDFGDLQMFSDACVSERLLIYW